MKQTDILKIVNSEIIELKRRFRTMGRIRNISDQTYAYAQEMAGHIKELKKNYDLTFNEACKVMELTLKDMQNEIEWDKKNSD